jgi:hypothetical protein
VGWRSHAKRLRQLQDENAKLKRLLADVMGTREVWNLQERINYISVGS